MEVGYESTTQFSREYSLLFGQPPIRNVRALRQVLGGDPFRSASDDRNRGAGSGSIALLSRRGGRRTLSPPTNIFGLRKAESRSEKDDDSQNRMPLAGNSNQLTLAVMGVRPPPGITLSIEQLAQNRRLAVSVMVSSRRRVLDKRGRADLIAFPLRSLPLLIWDDR
jgi:hypothetical protein